MGINSESDIAANLQIGPTDQGMVRLYVQGDGIDLGDARVAGREPPQERKSIPCAAQLGQPNGCANSGSRNTCSRRAAWRANLATSILRRAAASGSCSPMRMISAS